MFSRVRAGSVSPFYNCFYSPNTWSGSTRLTKAIFSSTFRHLYALHCLARKEVMAYEATHPTSTVSPRVALRRASLASSSTNSGDMPNGNVNGNGTGPLSPSKLHTPEIDLDRPTIPAIFKDSGYNLLGTSVLSTSNCGNPALRLFGFGPVTPEGYGIGELFTFPILLAYGTVC